MSLTPLSCQNAFAMIHKSRVPEAARRGQLFESAMARLVAWWREFFAVLPYGHLRSRTFEDVQAELARKEQWRAQDRKGKGRARDEESDEEAMISKVPSSSPPARKSLRMPLVHSSLLTGGEKFGIVRHQTGARCQAKVQSGTHEGRSRC